MNKLNARAWIALAVLALVMGLLLFIPAGSLRYWQAWVYLSIFIGASALVTLYLMKRDPALLERRMRGGPLAEKRPAPKLAMLGASIGFVALLVVPGLDCRYGWSAVPLGAVVAGNALVAIGFLVIFLVYRENSFTAATIQLAEGQRVISTGPYAIVRHPMYAGGALYLSSRHAARARLVLGARGGRGDASVSHLAASRRGTLSRRRSSRLCRVPTAGPVSPCAVRMVRVWCSSTASTTSLRTDTKSTTATAGCLANEAFFRAPACCLAPTGRLSQ